MTIKKVLIISASPRLHSNSNILAEAFANGAREGGNEVDFVRLRDLHLEFCRGCEACAKTGKCVIKDDVAGVLDKMRDADVIAFATPTYISEMAGQLKTLLDRTLPLYGRENRLKEIYILVTASEDEPEVPVRITNGVHGWVECFEGVSLAKTIFAGGVAAQKDIEGSAILGEAFSSGKEL